MDTHNPSSSNPWISYLPVASAANNAVKQTLYNTAQFYNIEKPNVFVGINAKTGQAVNNALTKRRYFPAELIKRDMDDYEALRTAHDALLVTYDALAKTYNAKLTESSKSYTEA